MELIYQGFRVLAEGLEWRVELVWRVSKGRGMIGCDDGHSEGRELGRC